MNSSVTELGQEIYDNKKGLKHLKFEYVSSEYVVTLVDNKGYEILRGYGNSIIEAINDLHHNLI